MLSATSPRLESFTTYSVLKPTFTVSTPTSHLLRMKSAAAGEGLWNPASLAESKFQRIIRGSHFLQSHSSLIKTVVFFFVPVRCLSGFAMCHFAVRPFIQDANCAKCATQILEISLSDVTELCLHRPQCWCFYRKWHSRFQIALHCG